MMENISVHQRRFEAAVKVMKNLPANGVFVPSDHVLLTFHTYHRQATAGACDTTEPGHLGALSPTERAAWKALGDMSKEEAMKAYVEEILLILETIPVTEEVSDLLEVLEPFYEVVEDEEDDATTKPATASFSDGAACRSADGGGSPVWNGSVSSLTNSTHGSLNPSEDEEEAEHVRETRPGSPGGVLHLLSDDGDDDDDDVSEPAEPRDAYGDSVRPERGSRGLGAAAVPGEGRGASTGGEGVSQAGRPQGTEPPSPRKAAHGTLQSVAERRGFECDVMPVTASGDPRIVAAVSRLQSDMRRVLASLDTLEARVASQVEICALRSQSRSAMENTISAGFLITWPFVVHLLVQLYHHHKRKTKL